MTDKYARIKHAVSLKLTGRQADKVSYLAEKHGLTKEEACGLLSRFGDDLDRLDEAARKLTAKRQS